MKGCKIREFDTHIHTYTTHTYLRISAVHTHTHVHAFKHHTRAHRVIEDSTAVANNAPFSLDCHGVMDDEEEYRCCDYNEYNYYCYYHYLLLATPTASTITTVTTITITIYGVVAKAN